MLTVTIKGSVDKFRQFEINEMENALKWVKAYIREEVLRDGSIDAFVRIEDCNGAMHYAQRYVMSTEDLVCL